MSKHMRENAPASAAQAQVEVTRRRPSGKRPKVGPASTGRPSPLCGLMLTALAVAFGACLLTFAKPCDHADASCLWAQRSLLGADAVLLVISVVRIFELDEGERRGLSFAAALLGVLFFLTPGLLIELCADTTMSCNLILQPVSRGAGALVFVVGAFDLVRRLLAIRK